MNNYIVRKKYNFRIISTINIRTVLTSIFKQSSHQLILSGDGYFFLSEKFDTREG